MEKKTAKERPLTMADIRLRATLGQPVWTRRPVALSAKEYAKHMRLRKAAHKHVLEALRLAEEACIDLRVSFKFPNVEENKAEGRHE